MSGKRVLYDEDDFYDHGDADEDYYGDYDDLDASGLVSKQASKTPAKVARVWIKHYTCMAPSPRHLGYTAGFQQKRE